MVRRASPNRVYGGFRNMVNTEFKDVVKTR
jgi:hypothetical protein